MDNSTIEEEDTPFSNNDIRSMFQQIMTSVTDLRDRIEAIESIEESKSNTPPADKPVESTTTPQVDESFFGKSLFMAGTAASRIPQRTQAAAAQPRMSLLDRNVENTANSAVKLSMQATQPSFNKVKLTDADSVLQVLTFIDEAVQYQTQYGLRLQLPSLISAPARRRLMAGSQLTPQKFFALDDPELFQLLEKQIRPQTQLTFAELLQKNVDFVIPKGYRPTPSDYKPFHASLLTYRHEFLRLFEILSKDNDENIPEIKNKEYGLLKVFIDKVPFEYGKRLFQCMRDKRFLDFYDFLKKWDAIVNEHEKFHRGALRLKECFGGTEWFARNQAAKINMIESSPMMVESGAKDGDLNADDDGYDSGNEVDQLIAALSVPTNSSTPKLVCLAKLLYGECKKSDCRYDHNALRLNEQRKRHSDLCLEQLKQSSSNKSSISVLQHPAEEAAEEESA